MEVLDHDSAVLADAEFILPLVLNLVQILAIFGARLQTTLIVQAVLGLRTAVIIIHSLKIDLLAIVVAKG